MRDLGTRDRLFLTHVVEHDLAIDVANRIRARNIRFFEIYASHRLASKTRDCHKKAQKAQKIELPFFSFSSLLSFVTFVPFCGYKLCASLWLNER
jgi:hypothetical protein